MKTFTFILLQPDTVANNYGEDTYLAYVEAPSAKLGIPLAQTQAHAALDPEGISQPADFLALAAFEGVHSSHI